MIIRYRRRFMDWFGFGSFTSIIIIIITTIIIIVVIVIIIIEMV